MSYVGTHQVVELDDGHGDGDGLIEDQVLHIWKRRKRKIKWAQGKGIFDRAILFCHSRHHRGCEWVKDT